MNPSLLMYPIDRLWLFISKILFSQREWEHYANILIINTTIILFLLYNWPAYLNYR